MSKNNLQKTIKAAGGTAALARELKISSQAISQWTQVPVQHVLKIESLTNIHRSEIRPDIYPKEQL